MPRLRLALAQTNPIVGDLSGNADQIVAAAKRAHEGGADLLALGEMAISGYPIEDLASRPASCAPPTTPSTPWLARLAEEGLGDLAVVVGHPDGPFEPRLLGTSQRADRDRAELRERAAGRPRRAPATPSTTCPTTRSSTSTASSSPATSCSCCGSRASDVAVIVCEDLWRDGGPVARVLHADAGLLLVINALAVRAGQGRGAAAAGHPAGHRDRHDRRLRQPRRRAGRPRLRRRHASWSTADGRILARAPQFARASAARRSRPRRRRRRGPARERACASSSRCPIDGDAATELAPDIAELPDDREQLWNALVLGLRDYVREERLPERRARPLRRHRLRACARRSRPTRSAPSGCTASPCRAVTARTGSRDRRRRPRRADRPALLGRADRRPRAAGRRASCARRESPPRTCRRGSRGIILMGESNMDGHLVLTTGNKTELAVGYSTIYGDSAGGFAPIKDVPKTLVWELASWRNAHAGRAARRRRSPRTRSRKPPSAELRPDQTDQDTLPPYELLDEHPRAVRDAASRPRRHRRARLRPGRRRVRHPARRPGRVEAPSGRDRAEDLGDGLRARPAPADHLPTRRLGAPPAWVSLA